MNFAWLNKYLASKINLEDEARKAVIYYVTLCSKNHSSSIIWIPKNVTIINKEGQIIYCGAIVKLDVKNENGLMGTGENAAKLLAQNGVALKVSQDGNIKIFANSTSDPIIY